MCRDGCSKIVITDRDRINDYSEYSSVYGIPIISGIEFNTDMRGMHILGYGIDDVTNVANIMLNLEMENQDVCYRVIEREILELMRNGLDGIEIVNRGISRL